MFVLLVLNIHFSHHFIIIWEHTPKYINQLMGNSSQLNEISPGSQLLITARAASNSGCEGQDSAFVKPMGTITSKVSCIHVNLSYITILL